MRITGLFWSDPHFSLPPIAVFFCSFRFTLFGVFAAFRPKDQDHRIHGSDGMHGKAHHLERPFMLREANWKDKLLYWIGRREIFRVSGTSMMPTLQDGAAVMISPGAGIEPGDIVLAQHPYKQSVKLLKRVASIDEKGRFSLAGDNPDESTDSRTFGTVSIEYIHGKAVCRVRSK